MKQALALMASSLSLATAADNGRCYVMAFSSGDEDAAYQAGALAGITSSDKLQASDYSYDAVSGISGGAINAVILASHEKGQEAQAAAKMEQFWTDAAHNKLYKDWFGGIARGLFMEGGLYNSAPLEDFLKKEFKDTTTLHRMMDIGITDVIDGSYQDFSDANIT